MLVSKVQSINFNNIKKIKRTETSSNNNQISFGMKYPKGVKVLMASLMFFSASCQNLLSKKARYVSPPELKQICLDAEYNHLFPNYGAKNDTLLAARNIIKYISNSIKDTCDVNKIIRTLNEKGDAILESNGNPIEEKAYKKAAEAIEKEVSASEKIKP